ncbi:hypothetical protein [Psychrosphaera algicola]|uniref:Uncharacterized protein n=1 Tax=Psychrosphaera algicola TaxID=3023714 RepID=A0ABT5FD97_9GAMM|nr:hypothetical protein [Psychrosphaera sp. G1-22]MDC2889518.1 hypothetical protein [Psychrosphaera sp. G1-22]
MWLVLCRENNNDPLADHIGCENAGGEAAYLFIIEMAFFIRWYFRHQVKPPLWLT